MMDLYDHSLLTIVLVGLALILGTSEIGHRVGTWAAVRGGDDVSTLESAVLGLLALIIAFTLRAAIDRSNVLQEALWRQAKAMVAKDSWVVPTGLFIQTLNEMIDSQGKRLAALRNQIPNSALLLGLGVAAVAAGFIGYASGLDATHPINRLYLWSADIRRRILHSRSR